MWPPLLARTLCLLNALLMHFLTKKKKHWAFIPFISFTSEISKENYKTHNFNYNLMLLFESSTWTAPLEKQNKYNKEEGQERHLWMKNGNIIVLAGPCTSFDLEVGVIIG